ncbi:MAG: hypothetical protein JNK82_35500 [Myxococcaceae bacterium]|nr:hypothetical protein [Myxococcaceae bacterium]
MSPALSEEEEDFVRWMDELDLDEVNLLDEGTMAEPEPAVQPGERLSGERQNIELPPSRGVGWDEG